MQNAVSDYLQEWLAAKDHHALRFLKQSLGYVRHCPVNINDIQSAIALIEPAYSSIEFCLKNQPITSDSTVAVEWEMRCHNVVGPVKGTSGSIPQILTLSGSDFIRLSNNRIEAIDLYFDPAPFARLLTPKPLIVAKQSNNEKYQRSGISPSISKEIALHLEHLMREEKIYRRSDLTLSTLSNITGLHANHLSQAVNQQYSKSFNQWLSYYRVEEATAMLQSPSHRQVSALDIALAVGFNSKSVFYTAFKTLNGITPHQFRKQAQAGIQQSATQLNHCT